MSTQPVSGSTSTSQTAAPFGNTGVCISLSAAIRNGPSLSAVRRAISNRSSEWFADAEVGNLPAQHRQRSEEHTSELQSLMRNSYAVFCLKKQQIEHYEM